MSENTFRSNRILSPNDAKPWEGLLRSRSGVARYSRADRVLEEAARSVGREDASVWIFESEKAIEDNQELTREEKFFAQKLLREQGSYAGWLRIGFGPQARTSAMGLLRGEDDYEIVRPYYGGH